MLSRVLGIELAATCIVVAGNDGQHEHICWWNVSFFFGGGKSKFLVIRPNVWQSNSRVLLMKYRSVPGVFLLRVFCDEPKNPSYPKLPEVLLVQTHFWYRSIPTFLGQIAVLPTDQRNG